MPAQPSPFLPPPFFLSCVATGLAAVIALMFLPDRIARILLGGGAGVMAGYPLSYILYNYIKAPGDWGISGVVSLCAIGGLGGVIGGLAGRSERPLGVGGLAAWLAGAAVGLAFVPLIPVEVWDELPDWVYRFMIFLGPPAFGGILATATLRRSPSLPVAVGLATFAMVFAVPMLPAALRASRQLKQVIADGNVQELARRARNGYGGAAIALARLGRLDLCDAKTKSEFIAMYGGALTQPDASLREQSRQAITSMRLGREDLVAIVRLSLEGSTGEPEITNVVQTLADRSRQDIGTKAIRVAAWRELALGMRARRIDDAPLRRVVEGTDPAAREALAGWRAAWYKTP